MDKIGKTADLKTALAWSAKLGLGFRAFEPRLLEHARRGRLQVGAPNKQAAIEKAECNSALQLSKPVNSKI